MPDPTRPPSTWIRPDFAEIPSGLHPDQAEAVRMYRDGIVSIAAEVVIQHCERVGPDSDAIRDLTYLIALYARHETEL